MARGGMRVGEVLKLTLKDGQRKELTLREPKRGRIEVPCMKPQGIFHFTRTFLFFDWLANPAQTCVDLLAVFGSGDPLHPPEGS